MIRFKSIIQRTTLPPEVTTSMIPFRYELNKSWRIQIEPRRWDQGERTHLLSFAEINIQSRPSAKYNFAGNARLNIKTRNTPSLASSHNGFSNGRMSIFVKLFKHPYFHLVCCKVLLLQSLKLLDSHTLWNQQFLTETTDVINQIGTIEKTKAWPIAKQVHKHFLACNMLTSLPFLSYRMPKMK